MAISLRSLIMQEALNQGVPPAIALAVAQQESGISQWTPSGGLVTGTSGEIGVFQLMPGTAAQLGVNPADVNQNIQGGISYLSSLFQKYGDWSRALSAYNSGSPTGSPSYASSVLAIAGATPPPPPSGPSIPADLSSSSGDLEAAVTSNSGPWIVGGILAAVGLAYWLVGD
jgi:soluble lytic murein transglycosylase-like protein